MKLNKNFIIGIIIGGLIFGGIGVLAATYIASNNVTFTPSDSTWKVSNVQDALNDLYSSRGKVNLTSLGLVNCTSTAGGSSGRSANCNISGLYKNYANINISNIIVQLKVAKLYGGGLSQSWYLVQNDFSYSYNASSGIITISGFGTGIYGNGPVTANIYIYE